MQPAMILALLWLLTSGLAGCTLVESDSDRSSSASHSSSAITSSASSSSSMMQNASSAPTSSVRNTFRKTDNQYVGTVAVRGFLSTEIHEEPFCEFNCQEYTYVYLQLQPPIDAQLDAFLQELQGNTFVQENAVGIGCLEDQRIRYDNVTMENGMQEYVLDASETQRLLNATADNPASVILHRERPGPGMGAPACYSHFSNITVQ